MEGQEVALLDERKVFENNGLKYVYDYNLLNTEQVEVAKEIVRFKEDQIQRGTGNLNDLFKSRAVEYFSIVLSFLLLEVKDGKVQPFNCDLAEMKTLPFIKALKAKANHSRLKECLNDFLVNADLEQFVSTILVGKKPPKSMQELIMEQMATMILTTPKSKEI